MSIRILTKNAVENTNIDGARQNHFNAGMQSGVVKGAFNEGNIFSPTLNAIAIDSCELRISGHQIVIDSAEYITLNDKPYDAKRLSLIAQIKVTEFSEPEFEFIVQAEKVKLIQDNLFENERGNGIYQLKLCNFTLGTDGVIRNVIRVVETITGGTNSAVKTDIEFTATATELSASSQPEAVITYNHETDTYDLVFGIPRGGGTDVQVGGISQGIVEFKSDPQKQLDTLNSKITTSSSFSYEVVDKLPTENISPTTFYLLKTNDVTGNNYEEYLYVNNEWELIGSTNINLENVATEDFVKGYTYDKNTIDTANARLQGSITENKEKIDKINNSGYITKDVDNLTNYTKSGDLSKVATSNDYNDLDNKPSIPTKLPTPNTLTLKVDGVTKAEFDGSEAKTFNVELPNIDAIVDVVNNQNEIIAELEQDIIANTNAISDKADASDVTANTNAISTINSKLNGIQSGAEVNVQSDWNVTDTSSDAYIKNKPTIPSISGLASESYVNTQVNTLQGKIDEKADKTDLDDYALKTELSTGLASKLDKSALSNYYDETEVNNLLADKVDKTTTINNKPLSSNITLTANDVGALPNTTKYGATLSLTMNTSTYVVTAQLKDQAGNNLGTAQTIDLPLESVVVSGSYDDTNKKVILTLKDGSTIGFSVADLIDGLASQSDLDEYLPLAGGDMTGTINHTYSGSTDYSKTELSVNDTSIISTVHEDGSNSPTTVNFGSTSSSVNLRGKNTNPTYNNNDLALKSDVITKTSQLENDAGFITTAPEGVALYETTGSNTDGAMTQKATTDELNKKVSKGTTLVGGQLAQYTTNGTLETTGITPTDVMTLSTTQTVSGAKSFNANNHLIATCNTAYSSTTKTASLTGFTSNHFTDGCEIYVKFVNGNTAGSRTSPVTLNVNNAGAKTMVVAESATLGSYNQNINLFGQWANNDVIKFRYYATYSYWVAVENVTQHKLYGFANTTLYSTTGTSETAGMTQKAITDALSGKANTSDIPDISNLATKDEIPDVSNLASKDEIPTDYVSTNTYNADMSTKADKVSGATVNNLASLDYTGNLQDSGIAKSSVATTTNVTTFSMLPSSEWINNIFGTTKPLAVGTYTYTPNSNGYVVVWGQGGAGSTISLQSNSDRIISETKTTANNQDFSLFVPVANGQTVTLKVVSVALKAIWQHKFIQVKGDI